MSESGSEQGTGLSRARPTAPIRLVGGRCDRRPSQDRRVVHALPAELRSWLGELMVRRKAAPDSLGDLLRASDFELLASEEGAGAVPYSVLARWLEALVRLHGGGTRRVCASLADRLVARLSAEGRLDPCEVAGKGRVREAVQPGLMAAATFEGAEPGRADALPTTLLWVFERAADRIGRPTPR